MNVSPQVNARVQAKLIEKIAVLNSKYNINLPMPSVEYTNATRIAGSAHFRDWKIKLSAPYLMDPANVDEMVDDTVPHELAHLVAFKLYPETMERGPMQLTRAGWKAGKREVHGPRWQEVMLAMGNTPTRTHDMKLSDDAVIKPTIRANQRQDKWTCSRCKFVLTLTPMKSQRLRLNPNAIYHKGCRGALLIEGDKSNEDMVTPVALTPVALVQQMGRAPIKPQNPPKVNNAGGSKMDICKSLYVTFRQLGRAQLIEKFVSQAGCTPAGAATYYATCKKLYG